MSEWANLSPEQRRLARDNYLRTLKFSPEKKRRLGKPTNNSLMKIKNA